MDIWQSVSIKPGDVYQARIGPLVLWIRQLDNEMHVAQIHEAETQGSEVHGFQASQDVVPGGLCWSRWITGKDANQVRLSACLPNRAVVVRTESPVKILPGKEALFYVSMPIWLKVLVGKALDTELCDVPSVVRSNTWFGDSMEGELCYSLMTRARRHIQEADQPPYKAFCPVKIQNASDDRLDIERFCVRVEHLNLYQSKGMLWTNEVAISYQGAGHMSKVDYSRHKPKLDADVKLLTPPRTPLKETLLKRSVGSFVGLNDS